jgi:hypothetical protein
MLHKGLPNSVVCAMATKVLYYVQILNAPCRNLSIYNVGSDRIGPSEFDLASDFGLP